MLKFVVRAERHGWEVRFVRSCVVQLWHRCRNGVEIELFIYSWGEWAVYNSLSNSITSRGGLYFESM